ncbi:hypothetical protein [Allorhizobium borbori]|uniref:High-affinity K+ transport system ATPase subunit B n=1 Tax=Allorhizobium borbori TaxID=485907 RepID=A0A7W6P158_9HYPH|nr:hypothetical protein [Allorhizobium borbori]MBB4102384.1 high-affinity K+ transport system ATPase subunit B [Allorhizobium borbori]
MAIETAPEIELDSSHKVQSFLTDAADRFVMSYSTALFQSLLTPVNENTLDPVQQVIALDDAVKKGIVSRAEACRRMGYDIEEIDAERADEEARLLELEPTLSEFLEALRTTTPHTPPWG